MVDEDSRNTVTPVTRQEITDVLSCEWEWSGDLNEHDFLARLYPLKQLPSTDGRREYNANASEDIWQHRVNNSDWGSAAWVFTDERFDILAGSDEQFLRFLCETVHPLARSNTDAAMRMVETYNGCLRVDGWELFPAKKLSEKPVFSYRRISDTALRHLEQAKAVADRLSEYVVMQIRRLDEAVEKDPELAIGTAKEFLETLCKRILTERGVGLAKDEDFPALLRATIKSLKLVPKGLASPGATEKTVTVLLNNLGSIGHQLAELRNLYGTGHGKATDHVGLEKRHAKLAVGTASTLAAFLLESHEGSL